MSEYPDNVSVHPVGSAPSSRSRSSTKVVDDVTSLTSFNPFSEEDEHDQSSYALVSSLFSKVKNTLSAPLSSAGPSATPAHPSTSAGNGAPEQRRPSLQYSGSNQSNKSGPDRPTPFSINCSNPAPPLVSLTPVVSETPSYTGEYDRPPSRGAFYGPETPDGGGYAIPGFPIQDSDARSIRTNVSLKRSASVSKVIRRIRGEGLSRDYWMDDELCKECYDCKSVFTTWRRKHHCRICGQIFCSRCASNIIKGARFGQEGMVRVCNLCLDKLAKVDDDDDEDDRRSIISSMTSPFAAHQFGSESRLNLYAHPQSPFAASQLFGRTDEPFNLFSIAETKRLYSGSDESGFGSRPMTPMDTFATARFIRENPVPFRRVLTEEDKDSVSIGDRFQSDQSPYADRSRTPVEFPVTVPVSVEGAMSSVQFPVSSPDQPHALESPGVLRSRFNSDADFDGAPPFIRSRVQSRLGESFSVGAFGEPGWRTRRESTAYAQELNLISMFHLRIMLRQMLTAENIPNIREWEETLLKLALRVASELTFTAHPHRQGADMDVRRYVKIKKIPGGAPRDSEYVDGAVITKNVAHKQMSRNLRNPRVMLVTFPLEFHRVEGQYMNFAQIFRQEKEYLGNLASRIAALRPHVVLAEKSVSRLALDALAKRQIAVARAVKPSAVQFVARMTQGDVFSSMDKLALEPRLGHCARFRLQTFDHPLIPGRRKTYMRFEGCNSEMGCTILLRGGDIETLRRVKKVTRFLAFMVRNLKLETHLWKDSIITLPPLTAEATPPAYSSAEATTPIAGTSSAVIEEPSSAPGQSPASSHEVSITSAKDHHIEDLPDEDAEQIRLSRRIQESLEPYRKTFISVSATLRFPPPYPIRRMKELDDQLRRVKREWEDEVIRREERGNTSHKPDESTATVQASLLAPDPDDVAAQIESLPLPEPPKTPTPEGTTPFLDDRVGYFDLLPAPSPSFLPQGLIASPLPRTPLERPSIRLKTSDDIALESRYQEAKWQHSEQRRIWEWYLRKNRDDFQVEKYQCISLWELTLPMDELGLHRACFPPKLKYITFYGENDCTLGQFIENSVMDTLRQFLDPKAICDNKSCNQPLARHCKVYVHNETRLCVAVEQWDGQIINRMNHLPSPDTIITWSACRVCGSATPFIPVSPEMQRYSFAKFLELHFYPAEVQLVQGAGCEHNIYRHHVRYFAIKGMTVRFITDPIVLHEIVYPPMRIRIRPETQLEIKNTDYERLHRRNHVWYSALIDDLKLITIDAATGEEEVDAQLTLQINKLIQKAETEREEIARLIDKVYQESSPTDTLALNQVRAYRQDKIVAWQQDFDKLPKPRLTQPDKGGRRTAFGSVRAILPKKSDLYGTWDFDRSAPASVVEAAEHLSSRRRVTGDSFASMSSTSEASETESIPGQVEEKPPREQLLPQLSSNQTEEPVAAEPPALLPPVEIPETIPEPSKSDPESDSTIGASRGEGVLSDDIVSPLQQERHEETERPNQPAASKLPRRVSAYPSVAELVKKYQDYLPAQGVEDLTKTALAPGVPVSESEQEPECPPPFRPRVRQKARHQHFLSKRSSVSDFESSYAANIAPKYLTKRAPGQPSSRIPVASSAESRNQSRRTSPDKRPSFSRMNTDVTVRGGRSSPPLPKAGPSGPGSRLRNKPSLRLGPKDKMPPSRPPSVINGKSTFRRPTGVGNKVSNIAKHFERINKDNERSNRRYAVIRGKRARPVASARAKVEVLESIKDAIRDESESSDSSEADDEGGGADDDHPEQSLPKNKSSQDTPDPVLAAPAVVVQPASGQPTPATAPAELPEGQPEADMSAQPAAVPQEIPIEEVPPSMMNSPMLSPTTQSGMLPMTPPSTDTDLGPVGRPSILKALTGLWPQQAPVRNRMEADVDDPMADPEHIFRESSMVVRTDEPTSIIALALNSPQYRDMLAKSRAEKRFAREPKLTDGGEAFMPDDWSVAESSSTWGVVNVDSSDGADPTEELRVPSSKLPWQISFESGGLTISCTVLYPEQFDALRRTYDCERSIIESLARCVKFDASGGKSGSAFLKTLDDRFIAKELSRAELQAMETFAPAYFDYMSSAVVANRPTLLAKIFGCYKITFRKSHKHQSGSKSKVTQMNLLVMENLFYGRHFSKIYDLKGSTRNRHVQSTGRENEVLLDENLVETAHLAPFYVREHSKRILRGALFNDSKFLADINVMDYSLVVGVDSAKNELVVGIVDYIRTYTWDKKLESWVKDTAFLGGANKGEPTIIGPKQYRHRFLSAMERYFPLVPDRWMKQPDAPEEEGNSLLDLWPDW
ncbi:hypothetical protein PYCCODRAFT_1361249 [Trametes coccinea BRFM310]|uniref:1-phosphatidylinositol-3-phosphate 5-kinase n=1 Tax=Trametes coccinea (strain BRFM310) TaxID=1353009 RepID=A0A1Y2IYJ1_TRAC3|nr:hypothetical protein PYCCODRAFT_1361249 [Trametes coccinea BRFM310]